jgi:YfiH family protein
MYLKSELLESIPGVIHGFGSLDEPIPSVFSAHWDPMKPQWKQVHGVSIACVTESTQSCGEVDSLYTEVPKLPIAVVTADCVPVLLAHQSGQWVAAVHAGWRGTRAHILQELWKKLESIGHKPSEWVAAIGPCIGPCCYQVSEELAHDFEKEFASLGKNVAVPRSRILDLPAINAGELKQIGIQKVDVLGVCTLCSTQPRFHSFRREGGGTRQYSMIMKT